MCAPLTRRLPVDRGLVTLSLLFPAQLNFSLLVNVQYLHQHSSPSLRTSRNILHMGIIKLGKVHQAIYAGQDFPQNAPKSIIFLTLPI